MEFSPLPAGFKHAFRVCESFFRSHSRGVRQQPSDFFLVKPYRMLFIMHACLKLLVAFFQNQRTKFKQKTDTQIYVFFNFNNSKIKQTSVENLQRVCSKLQFFNGFIFFSDGFLVRWLTAGAQGQILVFRREKKKVWITHN